MLVFLGDDLDNIAALQFMLELYDLAVHLGPDAGVTHGRVNGVGKIDGGAASRQFTNLAGRGQGIDIGFKQFPPHRFHEFARIFNLLQGLHQFFQALEQLGVAAADLLPLLVGPMRGHAFLGHPVHLFGADLDFDKMTARPGHGGVQRLVVIRFRRADKILDPAGYRWPIGMNRAQRLVAFLDGANDDTEGHLVINPFQRNLLHNQLFIDGINMLGPPDDTHRHDFTGPELAVEDLDHLVDIGLTLAQGVLKVTD